MTTARFVVAAARTDQPGRTKAADSSVNQVYSARGGTAETRRRPAGAPVFVPPPASAEKKQAEKLQAGKKKPRKARRAEAQKTPVAAPRHSAATRGHAGRAVEPARRSSPVSALRITAWQVAVVLGFVATGRGPVVGTVAGVAAAGLLLVSAVRVRGVWLSSLAGTWMGFVVRRKSFAGEHLPLPPRASIASDGVLVRAEGLTVVARTREKGFPEVEADADGPEIDLQLVLHRGPQQERPGAWLAVTVRRDAEVAADETLRVTLGNVLRRLRKSGREFVPLSAVDLGATLHGVAHAGPSRERWRGWRSGPISQVTLSFDGAPREAVDRLLAERRDVALTIAIRPAGDGVLRVAATSPGAADRAVSRLTTLAAHLGVRLHRLDGRHGPAVLASLPIGGAL